MLIDKIEIGWEEILGLVSYEDPHCGFHTVDSKVDRKNLFHFHSFKPWSQFADKKRATCRTISRCPKRWLSSRWFSCRIRLSCWENRLNRWTDETWCSSLVFPKELLVAEETLSVVKTLYTLRRVDFSNMCANHMAALKNGQLRTVRTAFEVVWIGEGFIG